MRNHEFFSYEVGEEVTFVTNDGYTVHGRVCHIRYSKGVRSERVLYQISGCTGHPKYTVFWVSVGKGKEVCYAIS